MIRLAICSTDEQPPVTEAPATTIQVQRMGILAGKIYAKEELETVFRPWLRELRC